MRYLKQFFVFVQHIDRVGAREKVLGYPSHSRVSCWFCSFVCFSERCVSPGSQLLYDTIYIDYTQKKKEN